ncbi:hypothetical protein HPB48_014339 [Haemaphysalis longicornis]|uniref:Ig-like domain-containing protein n=1 Tax=Haemaphysalis longicornis TaxID=44386 RepID=A0A9J6G416_HAELO|nr:hypothetical protein HPB48_014339 [Haemaphysalis longicornis]
MQRQHCRLLCTCQSERRLQRPACPRCVQVLWIRRRDYNVLTVGLDTYTADDRFQAVHLERSSDWALQIRYVQLSDQGLYECQVSSDPKISYFVNLTVLGSVRHALSRGGGVFCLVLRADGLFSRLTP